MWQRNTLVSRFLRALLPERIPWFAASLYDRIALTAIETYYKDVAESVVAHRNEGVILDLGTGPGYLPIEIAKRAPLLRVVGIDSSKALVRIARTNAEKAGVSDRVQLVKCDANRIHFDADSFDMVISTGSLHAWKDPVIVINECFRVLRPGCEVWLLDPAEVVTPEALRILEKGLKGMDRAAGWWGSFSSKLTPAYSVREMEEIVRLTKFKAGKITEGKWLTVKLKKEGK